MKRLLTASPLSRRLTATSMSRRYLAVRRLAVLISAVLVLSIPTVASASAGSQISTAVGARAATVDAALAAARPAAVAATTRNFIWNVSDIGIGVIHVRDGSYQHGTYDSILPSGAFTDQYLGWPGTGGWYTGPGYCTQQWRAEDGVNFSPQLPDLGPGQHFIGAHTSYIVNAYHC